MKPTLLTPLVQKLPSPLYKVLAQNYIDYEFPRHIFIETTANCNLSCAYCPREKRSENMDFRLFTSIIDECSQYGARSFSLHLFGEPLLYPSIMEGINYIKSKNVGHTILLTTNGTVLNKFARRLLDSGVDRIIWSWRKLLVPFSAETMEVLKRIGMVRLLVEETPKEEFEKWKTFPRVEIKHLHNYGGQIDLSRWKDDSEGSLPDLQGEIRWPCYHLWLAPAVRWNGEITICCNDSHGDESCGKYGRDTIFSIWKGDKIRGLREAHLNGEYKGLCKECNVWKTYPDMFFGFQKKNGHPVLSSI